MKRSKKEVHDLVMMVSHYYVQQGMTCGIVANMLGISKSTVSRIIKNYRLKDQEKEFIGMKD